VKRPFSQSIVRNVIDDELHIYVQFRSRDHTGEHALYSDVDIQTHLCGLGAFDAKQRLLVLTEHLPESKRPADPPLDERQDRGLHPREGKANTAQICYCLAVRRARAHARITSKGVIYGMIFEQRRG
jgi:hypothetical protein